MRSKIITYSNFLDEDHSLIGIQVLPESTAKQFVKAIKILEENNFQVDILNDRIPISLQDFQICTYSASDAKSLYKYFELEVIDGYSEPVRILPRRYHISNRRRTNGRRR